MTRYFTRFHFKLGTSYLLACESQDICILSPTGKIITTIDEFPNLIRRLV
ncbi:hypothetical protein KHC33_12450 [Methanospirillum sp. J.3.6.1-F.2.7.3]|uniref:Uncharacterized protein n=1 Tax=Methanospirillum purgamenti TaxID=2834276 RepID=A0A8E7EJ67_9EURY|nr:MULTISPECIES: hypothetical protein [Methanospirillum]MDX8550444.1 hypothetical protein [Methanospirillum hungatei]QVV88140.1 hypothetical protein KHC33_12450 [Methanospirillum sp. J.3.6.1-F.2.7.3]